MNFPIGTITKNFVNLIYPLHCAACKKILDPLNELRVCDFCISQIRHNPKPYCKSCGRSMQMAQDLCAECKKTKFHFERAYSACLYEGVLKELIHLFKYKGKLALTKILSGFIIDFIKENDEILNGIDAITFVPLQNRCFKQREFNQSKVLAFNLSKEFGMPLSDILEKARTTRRQNELSRDERLVNLKGAFRAGNGEVLKGLRILLIDDVMTTGATLSECSKALLDGGAKAVRCLTLARGI